MSAEAVAWVYRHSPYTGAALHVHLALADAANDLNNNEIWAKQSTISAKARVSRKTVNETVGLLVAREFLDLMEDNSRRGGESPNRYRFLFPTIPVVFGVTRGYTPADPVSPAVTPGSNDTLHPEREPKLEPKPSPVGDADEGVGLRADGTPSAASRIVGDAYPASFEACWGHYRKTRRGGKRAAYAAWRASIMREIAGGTKQGEAITLIRDATVRYMMLCTEVGTADQHVKLAATFWGPGEHYRAVLEDLPDGEAPGAWPEWMNG